MANPSRLAFCVGLLAVAAVPLLGQEEGTRFEGVDALKGMETSGIERPNFRAMLQGEPKAANDVERVASLAAKWFVYRITWKHIRTDPKKLELVHQEFDHDAIEIALKKENVGKNQEFVAVFSKKLQGCLAAILVLDMENAADRHAVVNAAVMLPQVARLKQEEFADYLTGLLKDPKTPDVVKHWAVKGLGEFFPARAFSDAFGDPANDPNKKLAQILKVKRERDLARVGALLDLINRPVPDNVHPDAFRYLRREVVRTLARTEIPAVMTRKDGSVEGTVAHGLLHVLAKPAAVGATDDFRFASHYAKGRSLYPPPTLGERFEAAIGVANMRFDKEVDPLELYNPEVAMYLVAHFLADFVDAYRTDFSNKTKLDGKKTIWAKPPALPWKMDAQRLDAALTSFDKMVNTRENLGLKEKSKALLAAARPFLKEIAKGESVADAVDRDNLDKLLPTDRFVFKTPKGKTPIKNRPNFVDDTEP